MGRGGMCILCIVLFGTWSMWWTLVFFFHIYPFLFLKSSLHSTFFFVLLVNGEEVCGCFSFDLTPFSLGRKEVRKDTLNKSERKTGVGTQSVDVSKWFISEVGNGTQLHPKTQTQGERRVNTW